VISLDLALTGTFGWYSKYNSSRTLPSLQALSGNSARNPYCSDIPFAKAPARLRWRGTVRAETLAPRVSWCVRLGSCSRSRRRPSPV